MLGKPGKNKLDSSCSVNKNAGKGVQGFDEGRHPLWGVGGEGGLV